MAILENIRKRTTVLILIIGLALFAFVISGIFNSNDFMGGGLPGSTVAEVNGIPISREDFGRQMEIAQNQSQGNLTGTQLVNRVYDQEVRKTLLNQQFEDLGIEVGPDQIVDFIQNTGYAQDPSFQDETGQFNPEVFQATIADWKQNNPVLYDNWLQIEEVILQSAKEQIYFNLVRAATSATLVEGKFEYKLDNDKVDFEYVRVPYNSIPDSTITVSKDEIAKYVKENAEDFKQEAARDIRFVYFEEKPSAADEETARASLLSLIDDKVTPGADTTYIDVQFKNTTDIAGFLQANRAKFDTTYVAKTSLPAVAADSIFGLSIGRIYGPYRDGDAFKVTRMINRKNNGNVKASHILFAYEGATRANPEVKRTKEEAEAEAQKILVEAKKSDADFAALARENSDGPTGPRGGDLGFFQEGVMTEKFNDFCFNNPVGTIGLVETEFGYHIIKVMEKQDLVQIATLTSPIEPSQETIDAIYTEATQFEMATKEADAEAFDNLAQEKNYTVRPVNQVKIMDENLPGLGVQRNMVTWAFKEAKVGDIRRFDLTNGYAIAQLTKIYKEGTMSPEDASATVLPILRKDKKAEQIMARSGQPALEDFATTHGVSKSTATAVTRKAPTVPGAGREPKVVGKAFALAEGAVSKAIKGETGVFMIKVKKKEEAITLQNFSTFANTLSNQNKAAVNSKLFEALKAGAKIEDNRADFY